MRAILFRRMEIDGVNYYQLFDEVDNFVPTDEYANCDDRKTKEYFYVDADSDIVVPDASILNLYCDDGSNGLKCIEDDELFMKIFEQFAEKYSIVIKRMKTVDEVVQSVGKKIMFQDSAIAHLVQRIYLNQSFVVSDLPIELKKNQKRNILFHGMSGSGKKTVIDCLHNELDIPYVDLTLSGNVKESIETIIKTLLNKASSPEEASTGIVYIYDNFEELADTLGDDISVYNILHYITSQKIINYRGKNIDFRTLTFVILYDDDKHDYSYKEVMNLTDCETNIYTKPLTNKEKYQVLFSENGSIHQYEKFLSNYGKRFIINKKYLMELIAKCSAINPSMDAINKLIDAVISYGTFNGIDDIRINKEFVEIFDSVIGDVFGKSDDEEPKKEISGDKYMFEKKVDQVFNETVRYVIGQDKQVRTFITQLLSNLNVANDTGLYSPESYMQNILIRGCTGSGKTFIAKTVCKILGVPYFMADATAYTEEGYVGLSPSDMFIGLYHAAGDDLAKAQKGILFIDEIDKKAQGNDNSGPSRKAVLNSLLKAAEGEVIKINVGGRLNEHYIDFDTSNVTFVCAGAFTGIEKIRDDRIGKSKIGFGSQDARKDSKSITKDDYVTYGLPEEFMGRVSSLIELNDMTKEDFINVMKKSELSALKIKKYLLAQRGIDIEYTDSFCEELAEVAIERKQGVRGIANALEEILSSINIQDIRASQVEKIILDGEVVKNPDKVILIERGNQKKLQIK